MVKRDDASRVRKRDVSVGVLLGQWLASRFVDCAERLLFRRCECLWVCVCVRRPCLLFTRVNVKSQQTGRWRGSETSAGGSARSVPYPFTSKRYMSDATKGIHCSILTAAFFSFQANLYGS